MRTARTLTPPRHLRKATKAWWKSVVTEWELDEHHVRLLTLACEAWDRAEEARETLARVGTFYRDRFHQPKPHPAVAIERDGRIAFARLLRELDLDHVTPPEAPRPPARH